MEKQCFVFVISVGNMEDRCEIAFDVRVDYNADIEEVCM
jgi:hypothetical protein